MSQAINPILGARRDQAFPTLAQSDIDRMRRFGEASAYAAGEHIVKAGDVAPGLIVSFQARLTSPRTVSSADAKRSSRTVRAASSASWRSFRLARRWSMRRPSSRSRPSSSPRSGCAT